MKTQITIRWIPPALLFLAVFFLASCSDDINPVDYQTHPNGWNEFSSAEFHGAAAIENRGAGCKGCHGDDFTGAGDAGSCYECHGSLHVGVRATQPVTHRIYAASLTWNLTHCKKCHGSDYAGGTSGVSCNNCHREDGGPAACGTCHAMPPVDDDGLPYGMLSGAAGAHAAHARFGCRECHGAANGLNHVDALPAEISFVNARVARQQSFSPVFTHIGSSESGNGSCATVYCHSDGRGNAAEIMPQWTAGGIGCGTCHQMPPPAPHPPNGVCHQCHSHVDPASDYSRHDGIRFLVDSLHVNGTATF